MTSRPLAPRLWSRCRAASTRTRSPNRPSATALGAQRLLAVDAAASFSRPGPRLADGVELLGHLLHPDAVVAPAGLAWHELSERAWASTGPSSR